MPAPPSPMTERTRPMTPAIASVGESPAASMPSARPCTMALPLYGVHPLPLNAPRFAGECGR